MRYFKRFGKYAVRKSGRAFTITLPAEWVKDHGVRAEDVYEIYESSVDGILVITKYYQGKTND